MQTHQQIKIQTQMLKGKKILLGDVYQKVEEANEKVKDYFNTIYDLKPVKIEDKSEHMIQVRSDKPYLNSSPGEFFPGIINPLSRKIVRQNLNIDTRFRENYYGSLSTNFNLSLPLGILAIFSPHMFFDFT